MNVDRNNSTSSSLDHETQLSIIKETMEALLYPKLDQLTTEIKELKQVINQKFDALSSGKFIFDGEHLILPTDLGLMCFPKNQLNHALSYLNFEFDRGIRLWIANNCKPHTTYIDIGANVGTFCGIASRRITGEGKIIAIEPIVEMEDSIRLNVQLNNPLVEFEFHGCAIGAKAGQAEFQLFEMDNRVSTLYKYGDSSRSSKTKTISSRIETFASLGIQPTKHLLIKIDAEGAEFEILKQLYDYFQLLNNVEVTICFEYGLPHLQRSGVSPQELLKFIELDFAVAGYFLHPESGAEHPPLSTESINESGNVVLRYHT